MLGPGDTWSNGSIRALCARYNTNEQLGDDKYVAFSIYIPSTIQQDELLWEFHMRSDIYAPNGSVIGNLSVTPHAIMSRGGDLEYRMLTGAGSWNGSSWTGWSNFNDRIKLLQPHPLNTWIDIIVHVNFQEVGGMCEVWVRTGSNAWPTSPTWSKTNTSTLQWIPGGQDPSIPTTIHNSTSTNPQSPGYWGLYTELGVYSGSSSVSGTDTVYHTGYRQGTSKDAVMADFPLPH
jgi:hypothetical protein